MKKEAYYFSHDANALEDPKCILLTEQLGMEAYGIFWALIERLRSEKDYKLPLIIVPALARKWNTSKEKVSAVINSYELFIIEDDKFFSERLTLSMLHKTQIGRDNAQKRWNNATALPPQYNSYAIKVKERKVKERKVFTAPTFLEVSEYCKERKNNVDANKFIDHYTSNGWKVGKNPMKDWRASIRTWERSSFETKVDKQITYPKVGANGEYIK